MHTQNSGNDTFGKRFGRNRADPHADRPLDAAGDKLPAVSTGEPEAAEESFARGPADPDLGSGLAGWIGEAFLAGLLYVLAAAAGIFGVVGGLYQLNAAAGRGVTASDWLSVGAWILAGLGAGGLLIGVGGLVGAQIRQRRQVRELRGEAAELSGRVERLSRLIPDPDVLDDLRNRLDRLDEAVEEVAHNTLLDETGRADKRRQLVQRQRDAAIAQIRREMVDGRWDRGRLAIERFRVNFPSDDEQARRLADELERRRQQAEEEDVAAARRKCEELMGVSAWNHARAAAAELVDKHPDSTAARGLLARIERERAIAQERHRQGLLAETQRRTSRREWSEALQAARRLVSTYPSSIEAEAIRPQMETLAANAEIQHRQHLESEIKELIRRQRFGEAVAAAEELIAVYPNSPQAVILRDQLPRLRERADESAREARKRRLQLG